ncbi:hypothetical protein HID58_058498 [Brassica napus]|uniref:Uncharacterized protein n=1 Tax=Brassica napus TaxID=3708 RepID=A0ABQ7ZQ87_BRANA|nr:hypothetical protein HID58_058498 [Brassica napus]
MHDNLRSHDSLCFCSVLSLKIRHRGRIEMKSQPELLPNSSPVSKLVSGKRFVSGKRWLYSTGFAGFRPRESGDSDSTVLSPASSPFYRFGLYGGVWSRCFSDSGVVPLELLSVEESRRNRWVRWSQFLACSVETIGGFVFPGDVFSVPVAVV